MELDRGDTRSGRNRACADVVATCVRAKGVSEIDGRDDVRVLRRGYGQASLQTVGLSNILKQTNKADNGDVFVSGKERRGKTFEEIFTGLETA